MWINNAEKGNRILIGGASPFIHELPRAFLDTGKVIGINRWPEPWRGESLPCDYWIGLDTGLNWEKYALSDNPEYADLPKFLPGLECPKFMRRPNLDTEAFVPSDVALFFDKAPHDQPIPVEWNGTLRGTNTTALPAINLAIIMGASEVVLYGVDFVGGARADGSQYPAPDFWADHEREINNTIRLFQQIVPVYKTNPASWLDCPLMEV